LDREHFGVCDDKNNKEALIIVRDANPLLEKVKKYPSMINYHDPRTEGQWIEHWLIEKKYHILHKIYGVVQLEGHSDAHDEVKKFVQDVYQTLEYNR